MTGGMPPALPEASPPDRDGWQVIRLRIDRGRVITAHAHAGRAVAIVPSGPGFEIAAIARARNPGESGAHAVVTTWPERHYALDQAKVAAERWSDRAQSAFAAGTASGAMRGRTGRQESRR